MYDLDVDGEYSGQRKYLTVEVVNSSQVADELATPRANCQCAESEPGASSSAVYQFYAEVLQSVLLRLLGLLQ